MNDLCFSSPIKEMAKSVFRPPYIPTDLDGGTCDFNVVTVNPDPLKSQIELKANNGCNAGGSFVDKKFMEFIEQMFGEADSKFKNDCLKQFMQKKMEYRCNREEQNQLESDRILGLRHPAESGVDL